MKTILLLLLLCSFSAAQKDSSETENDGSGWLALPVGFYTPETKFAFGAVGLVYFRFDDSPVESKPSNIIFQAIYTTNNQYILGIYPQLYWKNEEYFLNSKIEYAKFPYTFYGIGNNTAKENSEKFTHNFVVANLILQKNFFEKINAGPYAEYIYSEISETEPGGLLSSGTIPGSSGGHNAGLGFALTRDTRDNIMNPHSGSYINFYTLFFSSFLGGNYDFNKYLMEANYYHPIAEGHTLASQFYFMFAEGGPPFYLLSRLGGESRLRGFFKGRYSDKDYVALQTEYRFPLFWRIGGVVFAAAGDVARNISKFRLIEFKHSFGFGLRYLFDEKENMNVRLDIGFAEGSFEFYVAAREAF